MHKCYSLLYANFLTYQHGNRHFHSHIRCCQAICTTVTYYEWDLSFFFCYLFACFVNLFKTTLWFLRPFELLFILSLSPSDDPLPAAAQKPKRNSREWNRSSFSFERVLLRLATLPNIICTPRTIWFVLCVHVNGLECLNMYVCLYACRFACVLVLVFHLFSQL